MPNWPSPSFIPYVLLENPWPIAAIAAAIGAMAAFYGMRYRKRWLWTLTAAMLLVAIGVIALANTVESTREAVNRQTKSLVAVTLPPLDGAALKAILDENVTLDVEGVTAFSGRGELIQLAERVQQTIEFRAWSIQAIDAYKVNAGQAKSYVRLSTTVGQPSNAAMAIMGEGAISTTWQFDWQRDEAGAWRLVKIDWVKFGNQSPTATLLP